MTTILKEVVKAYSAMRQGSKQKPKSIKTAGLSKD